MKTFKSLQEEIQSLLIEGSGKAEYKKMEKYVDDMYTNNKRYTFTVKKMEGIGSFIISGDVSLIKKMISDYIGDSLTLFSSYGYTLKAVSKDRVLLMNFDMYLDAKWKQIWNH